MRDEIPETPLFSGIPLRSIPETTQKLDHRVSGILSGALCSLEKNMK
jgi:hypothetical protein